MSKKPTLSLALSGSKAQGTWWGYNWECEADTQGRGLAELPMGKIG